jgi:hypothetical protein
MNIFKTRRKKHITCIENIIKFNLQAPRPHNIISFNPNNIIVRQEKNTKTQMSTKTN